MSSKYPVRHALTLVVILLTVCLLPFSVAAAQEPSNTPEPGGIADAPYDPVAEATGQAIEDAYLREKASRSIFDFHIAYLIAPDAIAPDNVFSEQAVTETLGAVPFSSWEEFSAQNELFPFQILLIHGSMYEDIDTQWTRWAYRNRVMFAGLSTTFEQMAEITGDYCLIDYNLSGQKTSDTLWFFQYAVSLDNPQLREIVHLHELQLCDEKYGIKGISFSVLHGIKDLSIRGSDALEGLARSFITRSMDYGIVGQKPDASLTPTTTLTPTPTATSTSK